MASLAAPAMAQPHSVQGVKADDVLNIREDIHHTRDVSGSPVVGTIPPDADDVMVTGVSVDIGGATWREVAYNGTVGWVNARYLKPTSTMLQAPEALKCSGTEPFWSITIDEAGSTYNSPEQETPLTLDYLRFVPGLGRTDLWGHYLVSPDGITPLTVIVRHTEACTDGMSDLNFDYEAILLGLSPDGAPAYGCCSMTP
ncbi:hypothetical protein [Chachezhania antarctica]|uniref:hypothetical protein n=1 Tax=Chachezhania antarctica TaxID=2340860 RepID=UPI000EB5364D|nr:hypothetical protein [Chachezhania antarctica]|tara:strand:+ start:5294 stop:5890 length:597 start_codon:yes stop_codon:yes gene_type:complete